VEKKELVSRREFIGSLLAGMLIPNSNKSGIVLTGDVRAGDPSYVVCTIKGTSCGSTSKVLSLTYDEISAFMEKIKIGV
jgi:hypothetical protein